MSDKLVNKNAKTVDIDSVFEAPFVYFGKSK